MFQGLTAQLYGETGGLRGGGEGEAELSRGDVHGGIPAKWNSRTEGLLPMPEDTSSGDVIWANHQGELGKDSEANRARRGNVGSN